MAVNIWILRVRSLLSVLIVSLATLEGCAQLYPLIYPLFEKHTIVPALTCFQPSATNDFTTAKATERVLFCRKQGTDFAEMASNLFQMRVKGKEARLIALEVNQSVQDWRNSVLLVSNKETLVRAHVESLTTNVVEVRGVLRGFRNGVELLNSPRRPINPGGFIHALVNAGAARRSVASSLNFYLPLNWCTGTVTFWFESTNVECGEPSVTSLDCSTSVTFQPGPVPQVAFLRVKWFEEADSGNEPIPVSITEGQAQELAERLRAIYPIDRIDWTGPELVWTNTGPPKLEALLPWIEYIRVLNQNWFGHRRLCYGVLSGNRDGGLAYQGGQSSVGWMSGPWDKFGRNRHAHELGHNLGLDHPTLSLLGTNVLGERLGYCGEVARGNNPDFPFFELLNGQFKAAIGPLSANENSKIFGYDSHEGKIVDPMRTAELMSYCDLPDGRWASSFTYSNILAATDSRFGGSETLTVDEAPNLLDSYLLIRGTIDLTNDKLTFAPFTKFSGIDAPQYPADGAYIARASTTSGEIISDTGFALNKTDPDLSADFTRFASFTVALKENPDVKSISILRDKHVIATQAASPHAPQVRVIAPNGGENIVGDPVVIQWTGSDLDGDPLAYIVQYSPDNGSSWMTLAVDWPQQTYTADFASLPGSIRGLIRVVATDGFSTGSDQSDATFSVSNHRPRIRINQPKDPQIALGDQEVIFQASAHDLEDGDIPNANIQWQSSLDGVLGAGSSFSLSAISLSEGEHVITAMARDSSSATVSDVTHLTVLHATPAAFADIVLSQGKRTGSELDFTITIENQGPSLATGLKVTNTLPRDSAVFAVSSPSGPCIITNGMVICSIDEVAVGASVTIDLQLDLPGFGSYTNVAIVAAAELDPNPANNVALEVITLATATPQLQVELAGNMVSISWPATTPPNVVLRNSSALFPGNWTDVTRIPTVVRGRFNVTQEVARKSSFYRLQRR